MASLTNIGRIDCSSDDAPNAIRELRRQLSPKGDVVSPEGRARTIAAFGEPLTPEQVVSRICDDVRDRGLAAVLDYTRRLDRVTLDPPGVRVTHEELVEAHKTADPAYLRTIRRVRANLLAFQSGILHRDATFRRGKGCELRLRYRPLRRAATQTGRVMGTLAYMPPEQAGGEIAKIDARSDVFSLGAVLCVLLTGRPPYVGESAEAVHLMAVRAELLDARARLDGCGAEPELVALCKRCLSVKREDRPADANELATAVAGFRTATEERARQAELDRVRAEGERAKAEAETHEQRKRRKVQLALAASVALLLLTGGGFAWYSDRQASEQKLKDELAESDRKAERAGADAERKASEAKLKGEADAERRFKAEQARQGVKAYMKLALDLRKQYKFEAADTALVQAATMALGGAPELLPEAEHARNDLVFVVKLDDIRFRKWLYIAEPGGKGSFNTKIAAPEYRRAFAERGLKLEEFAPTEATNRIAASAVRVELVAAVDDWALYEPDVAVRARLLEIARKADPGAWTDRLRDPAVWSDKAAIAKLAAEVDPTSTAPSSLSVLVELMERLQFDPAPLLTSARAKHPTDFELAFALGLWHGRNSKDGQQIGSYEAARALRPDNVSVWNNLGNALADKGDVEGAIAAYKEAIRLDPKYALAHNNLGVALDDKGDKEGAIMAYKEAIQLDPKYVPAHYNLGIALKDKGDVEGAIAAYKEAIQLDPKYAEAHTNLGAIYLGQKKYAEAIGCAREAIKTDPKFSNAHAMLGSALQRSGDITGARAALTEAARLDKRWAPLLAKLPPIPVAPPPREVKH